METLMKFNQEERIMEARHIIIPVILFFLAACEPVEVDNTTLQNPVEGNNTDETAYTLTVQAYKNVDTKALELANEGATLNAYWAANEKVGVYVNGVHRGTLLATPKAEKSSEATLSGTMSNAGELQPNDVIWLLFPDRTDGKWDYTGQSGAAPTETGDLATRFDYASAALTVSAVDTENKKVTTTGPATFENEQSMYRFGFKVNGSGDPIAVKEFMITSNQGQLVRSREWSSSAKNWTSKRGSITVISPSAPTGNLYYMSLRNENITADDTYSFQVIVGDNDALYLGTKTVASGYLGNGKFISAQGVEITQAQMSPSTTGTISQASEVF